jgi:hypothetical protein
MALAIVSIDKTRNGGRDTQPGTDAVVEEHGEWAAGHDPERARGSGGVALRGRPGRPEGTAGSP